MEYMLLRHRDIDNLNQIDTFLKEDGFEGLKKALKMETTDVTNEVKAAGLRGRGGAGFPAGVKWSFMDNNNWPHYVVANADESEPGTFKDREIMESNPFQFLEGIAISSFAVGANAAYIYLRGEFWEVAHFSCPLLTLKKRVATTHNQDFFFIGRHTVSSTLALDPASTCLLASQLNPSKLH